MKRIEVYNEGGLPTAPVESFHELQEDFKITDVDKLMKLELLIITRGFKYSFKVWKDPDGILWIIDAHQRKKALIALKKKGFEVPDIPYEPIHARDKREAVEEIAAYNSQFATLNPDTILFKKYNIEAESLSQFNLDIDFGKISFEDSTPGKEIAQDVPIETIEEDDFNYSEKQKDTNVVSGDIVLLGDNRLICADSTIEDNISKLVDGAKIDLLVTDPPYNVNYTGGTKKHLKIQNDNMDDERFQQFLHNSFVAADTAMKPGAAFYIWYASSQSLNFTTAMKLAGWMQRQQLIWNKNQFILGRQDYQWKHEACLYGWKDGASHYFVDTRNLTTVITNDIDVDTMSIDALRQIVKEVLSVGLPTTVIDEDKPLFNREHPTMKPIRLFARLIHNSSKPGDNVMDVFGGSGTTLMASEQLHRRCFMSELDPVYCDVIIRRYHKMFPDKEIVLIRNSQKLDQESSKNILDYERDTTNK
jgi:DNA modification methylase